MTDTPRKEDRRKERTRQLLRDALMELIVEKGYEDINIQDITDRANVARPTFYLHFKDKKELLLNSLLEIYESLAQIYRPKTRETIIETVNTPEQIEGTDFQHVTENSDFYHTMLTDEGSLAFFLAVLRYLRNMMENDAIPCMISSSQSFRMPKGAVAACFAGAQIALVEWWFDNNEQQYSPQEMAQMLFFQTLFGMNWSLKLDIPAPDIQIPVRKTDSG